MPRKWQYKFFCVNFLGAADIAEMRAEQKKEIKALQDEHVEATGGLLRIADLSIVNFVKELKSKIAPSLLSAEKLLICCPVIRKDETGTRINGKGHWLHVNSTKDFSRFSVHEKRGNKADIDIGILTGYSGILMHDHMKGLYKFKL
jgi:hypothetical protein